MAPNDVAALTRELLDGDHNVVGCAATPAGIQIQVRQIDDTCELRRIFGFPVEYVKASEC